MVSNLAVSILNNEDDETSSCEVCLTGKIHDASYPRAGIHKTARPLELIHSDVVGPIQVNRWGGARYLLTFTDDYTRKTFGYLMKAKSEMCNEKKSQRKMDYLVFLAMRNLSLDLDTRSVIV